MYHIFDKQWPAQSLSYGTAIQVFHHLKNKSLKDFVVIKDECDIIKMVPMCYKNLIPEMYHQFVYDLQHL